MTTLHDAHVHTANVHSWEQSEEAIQLRTQHIEDDLEGCESQLTPYTGDITIAEDDTDDIIPF